MGAEARANRPFVLSRKDFVARLARIVQYISGAAITTVGVSWCDESEHEIRSDTRCATSYGETSSGRPIGSFPGELPGVIASGHLAELLRLVETQKEGLDAALEKFKLEQEQAKDDLGAAPPDGYEEPLLVPPPDTREPDE